MNYVDAPPLGLIKYHKNNTTFMFVKAVERLGPNLFLVLYTKDKKGTSPAIYISFLTWRTTSRWGTDQPWWVLLGRIKRNGYRHGRTAISLSLADWGMDGIADNQHNYADLYFPDDNEGYERAKRSFLALGKAWWPNEFYNYGPTDG